MRSKLLVILLLLFSAEATWAIDVTPSPASIPIGQIINVTQYGAAGDGTTDDTVSLQAALNAVPAAGGQVYFPAKTYAITAALVPKAETLLIGAGKTATTIAITSSTVGINAFTVTSKNRVSFEKLRIRVNGNSQRGIEFAGSQENQIRDVVIYSAVVGNGIGVLVHSAGGTGSYNHHYDAVQFENLGTGVQLGVQADSNPGANVHTFTACKWSSNGLGMDIRYATGITVVGGRFEIQTTYGIDAAPNVGDLLADLTVVGTYFESNTTNHIRLSSRVTDTTFANLTLVGGTTSDAGVNTIWIGNDRGTPGRVNTPRLLADRIGPTNVSGYQDGPTTSIAKVNRTLVGQITGVANNTATGLITLTLSAVGGEDDRLSVILTYFVATESGATVSSETGIVSFAFSQDSSNTAVASTPVITGASQSKDAGMTTLTITATATVASNVATLKLTSNSNPASASTMMFYATVFGGSRATSTAALAGGISAGF